MSYLPPLVVVLLTAVAATFLYRAVWYLAARESSRYLGRRFRESILSRSHGQRVKAFWGNLLLALVCVALIVVLGAYLGSVGYSI
ncbi:hypothetical protein BISA_1874 [Bifidobacterium saguini DSM 23967]|uniref:Uncharacterized protein n=1 Tax=Bifidobacterium saguini DSM 23967 TaxID=1437607 RepID=A0A087D6X4_9BIFI|nr:hypothetical protein [Bifidobacterium saguini]KFI91274.1 hypothetical protein BISA_1874 [Bifidobacterium saguini DSM 23967]